MATLLFQLALGTATSAGAVPVQAPSADYRIHSGDLLAVTVYGEPNLTQNVTVSADGSFEFPLVGRVAVAGRTPAEASAALNRSLQHFLREPLVSVGVVTQGELTIMVLGNVKTPGKYTLPFNSHVTDAVAVAGGMGPTNGDFPVARISDVTSVREASLQAIFRDGALDGDLVLNNNSVVYVPGPVAFNVEVVGAVANPGEIALSQGDRLSVAIARAGASDKSTADLNAISVTRDLGNGQTKVYNVNLYKELEKGDISADLELQKGDIIYVPVAKKSGRNITDTIFGLLGTLLHF